jgi:hypothetical protein
LTWKAALPDSKAMRFWSSFCTDSDGSAALEVASLCMIPAAVAAGGPMFGCPLPLRIVPPADATRALNHTVRPS